MKNCKNLTTSEVQMIMNGATMFVEPMKQNKYSYFGVPFCEEYPDLEAGQYTSTVVDKWGEEDAGPEIWGAISGKGEYCWRSPYQPGQIIYGRETCDLYAESCFDSVIVYKADVDSDYQPEFGWSPAQHMPKEAARIFLRIGSVQVVRVKSVNDEQAQLMGMPKMHLDDLGNTFSTHARGFGSYYIGRFGQESWDNNDWIWLFTFTRVNSING